MEKGGRLITGYTVSVEAGARTISIGSRADPCPQPRVRADHTSPDHAHAVPPQGYIQNMQRWDSEHAVSSSRRARALIRGGVGGGDRGGGGGVGGGGRHDAPPLCVLRREPVRRVPTRHVRGMSGGAWQACPALLRPGACLDGGSCRSRGRLRPAGGRPSSRPTGTHSARESEGRAPRQRGRRRAAADRAPPSLPTSP